MEYQPLNTTKNEIRLLHIAPSQQYEDQITCTFSLASLDKDIAYEALSYVWGDSKNMPSVNLEGHQVQVTKNLHSALRHLRFTDRERILWVDALCINQSNIQERSNQVSRMSSIYCQASCVIVFLGEAWEGSEIAIEVLQRMGENAKLHCDQNLEPSLEINGKGLESDEIQGYLIRFFQLPWWTRLWTVQEYVLAKNVVFQCGRRLLSGETIRKSREHIWTHDGDCCAKVGLQIVHETLGNSITECLDILSSMEFVRTSKENYTFPFILSHFRSRVATDTRDKIYGMLGLATIRYAERIEVDYTRSAEEVFEAATLASIKETRTLEIFSHLFGQRTLTLPSFVPDWTAAFPKQADYQSRLNYITFYNAGGGRQAVLRQVTPGKVATKGIIFDKIAQLGSLFGYVSNEDIVGEMRALGGIDRCPQDMYCHTDETHEMAFWHTLCGSMDMFKDHFEMDVYTEDLKKYFRRIGKSSNFSNNEKWQEWFLAPSPLDDELYDNNIGSIHQLFRGTAIGRRFAVTKLGLIGFVPESCEIGDLVVVMPGGSVPYVLRPAELPDNHGIEDKKCYTILGDAYIHGIMDGEAFEMSEK